MRLPDEFLISLDNAWHSRYCQPVFSDVVRKQTRIPCSFSQNVRDMNCRSAETVDKGGAAYMHVYNDYRFFLLLRKRNYLLRCTIMRDSFSPVRNLNNSVMQVRKEKEEVPFHVRRWRMF